MTQPGARATLDPSPPPSSGVAAATPLAPSLLLRRVWHKGADDNVFFLAGGLAFAILLAAVPFFLLCVAGIGWVLNQSPELSAVEIVGVLERLVPSIEGTGSLIAPIIHDVERTKAQAGLFGAVGFVWFSTRLFGTLRTVLDVALEVPKGRGIVKGKLFDIGLTLIAAVLIALYGALGAYLAIAHGRGVALLAQLGIRAEAMGAVEYWLGRALSAAMLVLLFYPLFRWLAHRKVRRQQALTAALVTTALFELARSGFGALLKVWNPGSLYTGTLAAIIVVVFWVYYAAMVFIIGAQVSQVIEDHRTGTPA